MQIFLLPRETCQSFLSKSEDSNTDLIAKEYKFCYIVITTYNWKQGFFFFILSVSFSSDHPSSWETRLYVIFPKLIGHLWSFMIIQG